MRAGMESSSSLLASPNAARPKPVAALLHSLFAVVVVALLATTVGLLVANKNSLNDNGRDIQLLKAVYSNGNLPYKYVAKHLTPLKLQLARGTCWDFGTIGPVEHIYRLQGIAQGFLKENEYVAFSEQAYGNQVLALCQQYEHNCLFPGDNVAFNSTEGGEVTLLYIFREAWKTRLLPNATCPYVDHADPVNPLNDVKCDGIETAIQQNPIRVTVNSMRSLYEVEAIKRALHSRGVAMSISVPIHTVSYYVPCSDQYYSGSDECTNKTHRCPVNFKDEFCVKIEAAMYNIEGEFRIHHAPELEAGHAMTVVGYNDEYVTQDGMKGGFIIRNTWKDGVYSWDEFKHMNARGSHSIPFFMQEISYDDEIFLCSMPWNPRHWYQCSYNTDDAAQAVKECQDKKNIDTAAANYMPLVLKCNPHLDPKLGICDPSDQSSSYYLVSNTPYGDDLSLLVFARSSPGKAAEFVTLKPQPLDNVALIFTPLDSEYRNPNEADYCGYYFMPYDVIRRTGALFQGFFVSDFDLTFEPSSYLKNAASYPQFNYTLLQQSTFTQAPLPVFDQPYANDVPISPPQTLLRSRPKLRA